MLTRTGSARQRIRQKKSRPASRTSADDASPAMADDIELAVSIVQVQRDHTIRLARRAADLGDFELDAVRNVDPHSMRLASRGAHNGAASGLEKGGDGNARDAFFDVRLKVDPIEDWLVDSRRHFAKDPPMGLCRFGLAPMQHSGERLALLLVSALIDDRLHRAVAFVDGARPGIHHGEAKAVKRDIAKVTAFDPAYFEAPAIAVRGASFELAGTAVIAVAAAESDSLNVPINHFHDPQMGGGALSD